MTPIPFTPFIPAPRIARVAEDLPEPVVETSVARLCVDAGIALRATSPHSPRVVVHAGMEHIRTPDAYLVGLGRGRFSKGRDSLRVLEVLAHAFHDYVARESVCGRGLFVAPARRGRPALRGRRMSAAERMRRHRARRER